VLAVAAVRTHADDGPGQACYQYASFRQSVGLGRLGRRAPEPRKLPPRGPGVEWGSRITTELTTHLTTVVRATPDAQRCTMLYDHARRDRFGLSKSSHGVGPAVNGIHPGLARRKSGRAAFRPSPVLDSTTSAPHAWSPVTCVTWQLQPGNAWCRPRVPRHAVPAGSLRARAGRTDARTPMFLREEDTKCRDSCS